MTTATTMIRPPRADDAEALVEINANAWRLAYQGILPHLALEKMVTRRNAEWWRARIAQRIDMLVLVFDRKLAGYGSVGVCRWREGDYDGEIFELYLDPVFQGVGFGGQLLRAARARLRERGLRNHLVWCLADNDGGCDFYRAMGGREVARVVERFGSADLPKIGFGWPSN